MQVNFYATLRPIVGGKTADVPFEPAEAGGLVRDLMIAIVSRWPDLREHIYDETGGLSRQVAIYVDGRNVRWLQGEDTVLKAHQKISIFPPVAGG